MFSFKDEKIKVREVEQFAQSHVTIRHLHPGLHFNRDYVDNQNLLQCCPRVENQSCKGHRDAFVRVLSKATKKGVMERDVLAWLSFCFAFSDSLWE